MTTVNFLNIFGQPITIPAATVVLVQDLVGGNIGVPAVAAIATPAAPTLTPSTTGGTLAAGTTYNYRVAAVNANGHTLAGPEAANATTTGTTSSISITWAAVTGAASYNVYGRIAGAELLLTNVTGTTYVDTGALTPAGALPASNTTASTATIVSEIEAGVPQFSMPKTYIDGTTQVAYGNDYKVSFSGLAGYTSTYAFRLNVTPEDIVFCNVLSDAEIATGLI